MPLKACLCAQDFFGGITIFTPQQLRAVGGYGTNFWGYALA